MGRLVKIEFSCLTLIIRPGSRSYVYRVMMAVRPITIPYVRSEGFQEKPYFLSIVRLFSDSKEHPKAS